ncbi:MAG: ACP S-malonyltransferase [Nitrococcus sp.]|nr:ACP S-malonyltransferase [Nitrococcus sp.]
MSENSKLAIVFPGQGSQSVGMLSDLSKAFPTTVRGTFQEASAALQVDLWEMVQNGPQSELNRTECTQPAMLAAGIAVWRCWRAQGGATPVVLAGHSLGEYTALVCAGALDFEVATRLVADRGRIMQEAVSAGHGRMAAILGLDDDQVRLVCQEAAQGEVVEAVNFNAPGQVVIAGCTAAVERAVTLAHAAGAKRALELPVSIPSHCALMRPAAAKLAQCLEAVQINAPALPVLHNVDVSVAVRPQTIRDCLVKQLHSPVRWVEIIRRMAADGVERVIECGPGKVLAGLNRRIDRRMDVDAVFDSASLDKALLRGS